MKTKSVGVLVSSAVLTLSVMALGSTIVNAQVAAGPAPATCDAEVQYSWPGAGFDLLGGSIVSVALSVGPPVGVLPVSRTLPAAVPAGTYEVDTVAYDGNANRAAGTPQMFEQFHLEFLDGVGAIIASTATTVDLTDNVVEATWAGSVGQVVLDRPAVEIRAMHSFQFVTDPDTANSVMPICVGVTPVIAPTTTTTEAPATTTTAAPTTTTTVATEVLPAVEIAEPAEPTPGTPVFTG